MNSNGLSIIRGTSIALIEIDQSGKIVQLKLANPSGHTIIDEHWLKILRASSPFQPIPKTWPKDHLKFTYTLNYRYGSG
jgi:TonB family protein